jgi:DNA integrity scanning protein DisA with diadenylate cyclase activity
LLTIKANTFKELTIKHAFQNSRLWLIDVAQALKQLQKYSKLVVNTVSQLPLATLKGLKTQL